MADVESLKLALIAAHNSGDTEAAELFASRINAMVASGQKTDVKTGEQIDDESYSSAWKQVRDPESSLRTGVLRSAVQMGKSLSDVGTGAAQLGVDVLNMLPGVDIDRSALDIQAEQSEQAGKFLGEQPGGSTGQFAGSSLATLPFAFAKAPESVAKAVSAGMKSSPVVTSTVGGTVAGGGLGAIAPVTDDRSRTENIAGGAASGAIGGAIGGGVGRAVTPSTASTDAYRERMVRLADAMGVKLTPGQRTGSVPLQQLEASLASNPITAGPFARLRESNQRAINKAVAKSFGEDVDVLTPEVIDNAFTRIGTKFEDATKNVRVPIDKQFVDDLGIVLREYRSKLPSMQNPRIEALVKDLEQFFPQQGQNVKLKGEVYQKIASDLSRISRAAASGQNADMEYARALLGVKEVLDDAASRAMSPEAQAAFREARSQYRNLVTAVNSGAIKAENVSAKTLKNAMARKDRYGMARGKDKSSMAAAGRVGEYFAPIVGDSGTAARMSVPVILGGSSIAGGLGAAAAGGTGAIAAPLLAAGAANLGTRAYLSPIGQKYISNSLLDAVSRESLGEAGGILGYLVNQ